MKPKSWFGEFDEAAPLEWATVAAGLVLLCAAWAMDGAWFDAHILPSFFIARHTQMTAMAAARCGLILAGLLVILVARPFMARRFRSMGAFRFCVAMAVVPASVAAAVVCAELILQTQKWQSLQARHLLREPRRRVDARLGWTHLPDHTGRDRIGGRWVSYAFDGNGYRVAAAGADTDLAAPSLIFTGESVMLGYGLDWGETIPARVGADLGVQPVNLAVTGYSTDQAFLRLRADLPRFRCPLGIVGIFMPSFLDRNLNTDRPHLGTDLHLHEAHVGWRLAVLSRHALSYRSERSIDDGVTMTTAVLRATKSLAEARGARMVIVVPAFMPESRAEQTIRRRVLDEAGLEYILVPLEAKLQIAGDGHPNPKAAALVAAAISARLRSQGIRNAAQRSIQERGRRCDDS